MNGYELSRAWFDFCFENPERIRPTHSAVYFFAIEHCNRLGWKQKFGFPSQMVMEAVGIKNWRTYSKVLQDLVDFGFIQMIEKSKNQYSSNIIAIVKNTKANTKALDKALQKHGTKQGQSIVSINKQETNKQGTLQNARNFSEVQNNAPDKNDVLMFFAQQGINEPERTKMAKSFYLKWDAVGWTMNGARITNWSALADRFIENWRENEIRNRPPEEPKRKPLPTVAELAELERLARRKTRID